MSPAQTPNTASLKPISTPVTELCSTHRVFALGKHPPTALFWGFTAVLAFVTTLSPADLLCSWHYMLKLPLPGQMPHFFFNFSLVAGRYTGRGNWQVYSPGFWFFSALGVSHVRVCCRGVWQPTRQRLGRSHCAPWAAAPPALNAEGRGLPQSASLGCCSFQPASGLCVCCPLNPVPVRHGTVCAQGESETTRCRAQLCHSVPF